MSSRRKFLSLGAVVGAAALTAGSCIKAMAESKVEQTIEEVSDYVRIISPSDHDFDALLDSHFPGLMGSRQFQQIRSHAVLISNISSHKISACSSYWEIRTPTGGYDATIRHYFHRTSKKTHSSRFGLKGNKTRFTGKIPLLKPGAVRLVTPYFNWSSNRYHKHPRPSWRKILKENVSRKFMRHELGEAVSVKVTIDAAIIDGKRLVGPNKSDLATYFRITRNAEHDVAVEALKFLRSGASHNEVAIFLKKHINATLPARTNVKTYLYNAVRKRHAHVLLNRLQHAKPEQFVRTLRYLARKPNTLVGLPTSNS